jgi:hypothetical protein
VAEKPNADRDRARTQAALHMSAMNFSAGVVPLTAPLGSTDRASSRECEPSFVCKTEQKQAHSASEQRKEQVFGRKVISMSLDT